MNSTIFADPAVQATFDRHGYVACPVLTRAEVEALRQAMASLEPADAYAPAHRYHCSFLDDRLSYKQAAFALLRDAFARFMNEQLPDYVVLSANFYVKPPGRGELVGHQNWPVLADLDQTTLTVWCPLVDCDAENGTLHVVPGSHKLLPHVQSPRAPAYFDGFMAAVVGRYLRPVPTRAGDGVIFDDSLIHGSPDNRRAEPRVAVQLLCVPRGSAPVFHFVDGPDAFDLIAIDENFFLTHSPEALNERQPGWRSRGRAPNRNRALTQREFHNLLTRSRRARSPDKGGWLGRLKAGFARATGPS